VAKAQFEMKSERPLKHFVVAFLLAGACYLLFYPTIEHRRTRKGPWEIGFTRNAAGLATLVINQRNLAITNVLLVFAEQNVQATNELKTLIFTQPKPVPFDVPFGQCLFMDTTFLPGTVTLKIFNHEVELLPRVLVVDRQEHPWVSDSAITFHSLPTSGSPPAGRTQ
jgi:hypothetical protein